MRGRRKVAPEVPVSGFSRGRRRKDGRGGGKEGAFPRVRRKKTREVRKLRRATAPLGRQQAAGRWRRGWVRERKPLKRSRQAGGFGVEAQERIDAGNRGRAPGPEQGSEERSPGAWEAERGFRGRENRTRREGSQTLRVGPSEGKATPFGRPANAGRRKGFSGPATLKGTGAERGDPSGVPEESRWSRTGNELRGKPPGWRVSPGEDARGVRRLTPSSPAPENPKGRSKAGRGERKPWAF
jgi:hypothetical protein